jgi:hypothetical protein
MRTDFLVGTGDHNNCFKIAWCRPFGLRELAKPQGEPLGETINRHAGTLAQAFLTEPHCILRQHVFENRRGNDPLG